MTVSTLKKKLVSQGIQVVRDLHKQYYEDSSKKKPLLEDEGKGFVFLQIMLKKIPKSKLTKMIKVNLPHPLIKDTDEVCLIVGDLDKMDRKADIEPDVLHYKGLLDRCGVTHVSEVMTLRQLRTEYKPYEAKQKLLAAYDVFLVDNRITECLPRVLGKHFFKKRKFPIQIDLKPSNLKQRIEKALSTKVFYITGQGNCCSSEVADLGMTDSEILENIMAMAETLHEKIPNTWDNIMGIYLKTSRSKAIPLYMSYGPIAEKGHKLALQVDFEQGISKEKTEVIKQKEKNIKQEPVTPDQSSEKNKSKTSQEETEKTVSDAFDSNSVSVEGKRKKKNKNSNEVADTISGKVKRKTLEEDTEKIVPDTFDESTSVSSKGKRKKQKHKISVENEHSVSDERKTSEEREKTVNDAFGNSSVPIEGKRKKGKNKNSNENAHIISSRDERKSSKEGTEKTVPGVFENSSICTEGKRKKRKNKNSNENVHTLSSRDIKKTSEVETEKTVSGAFESNSVSTEGKRKKKGKNEDSKENTHTISSRDKRKKTEEETDKTIPDTFESSSVSIERKRKKQKK